MELDKAKAVKLVIVLLATIAALAVMSVLVQVIQTVLPFLIVGAGIYAGYRWALGDAPAPTADEVEEQARGIFSRFRRAKTTVEATVKAGEALSDFAAKPERESEAKTVQASRKDAQTAGGPWARSQNPKAQRPKRNRPRPPATTLKRAGKRKSAS